MSSYYYDTVMLDNPMVFYPMDELSQSNGDQAVDVSKASEYAMNGIYVGDQPVNDAMPLVSGGGRGTVLDSDNYISIPPLEAWSKSRETYQFSFECWFLLNGNHQGGIRLLQPMTTVGPAPENYIGIEDGQIVYKISNATSTRAFPENIVVNHNLLDIDVSHHLVMTYDNGFIKLYIDNKLVEVSKATFKVDWGFSTTGFRISGPSNGTITIDGVAMYRYILPESSIQRHYLLGRSTIGSQEIARRSRGHFFPIDDADSNGVIDIDWPYDSQYKWPYWDKTHNVDISGSRIGLLDITSPDSVDDNIMFTGGGFQVVAGSKLLSDAQSTFNNGINLFENSSFDVDVSGDLIPDGWGVVNTATSAFQTITPDAMSSQNAVLLTLVSGTAGQKIGIKNSSKIPITESVASGSESTLYGTLPIELPSPEYDANAGAELSNVATISFDVRGNISSQIFQVRVFQWDGVTALADTVIPINVPAAWSRRWAKFNIFEGATDIMVQFEIVSDGTSTGSVLLDNAMLERGDMHNEYVDGWYRYTTGGSGARPTISRSDIYDSGEYALNVSCNDGTSTHMGIMAEPLPVDPGDVLYSRLSTYMPTAPNGAQVGLWFLWYDQSGTFLSTSFSNYVNIVQGSWQPHYYAAEAPALATSARPCFVVRRLSTLDVGEYVVFDNAYASELSDEAAQYLVVEEMNRIASANEATAGVGFYLADFHSDITNKDFAIMSFDEEDTGISIVKKYDQLDSSHKIVLRHSYKDSGVPAQNDITLKVLTGGDYDAWHYALVSWQGDAWSAALDSGTWIVDDYDTSDLGSVLLSYDTELTLGAGLGGLSGLGTVIKNVKVYAEKPNLATFVADQTSNGNYYLPLNDDINICMSGYAEFIYDLTPIYDAIDDAKVEWGPVNNQVTLYGGTAPAPSTQLVNGFEPNPIRGGYCPSLTTTKYYLRAAFETTNAIYKPAYLSFLSMTMLDNVKFKTKTAGHEIKPSGSFTLATKSTPIINQFDRNGIKFKKSSQSKNLIMNGGFVYDTFGWWQNGAGQCQLDRSIEEYVSGGSSLKITAYRNTYRIRNAPTGPSVNYGLRNLLYDSGTAGFSTTNNSDVTIVGAPNTGTGAPVARIEKVSGGLDNYFGTSAADDLRIPVAISTQVSISCLVNRSVDKPLSLFIEQYNASNSLVSTSSTKLAASGLVGSWERLSHTVSTSATTTTIRMFLLMENADAWAPGDYIYVTDMNMYYGSGEVPYQWEPIYEPNSRQYYSQVSENTVYTLSLKAFSPSQAAGTIRLVLYWYNAAGTNISTSTGSSVSLTDSWQTISETFTSPAAAAYALVDIYGASVVKDSEVYIDEVQLESGAAVTEYEDSLFSGMYLETTKGHLKTNISEDGWVINNSLEQRIGAIEQWVKFDDQPVENLCSIRGDDLTSAQSLGVVTKTANQVFAGDYWTAVAPSTTGGIRLQVDLDKLSNGAYYIGTIEAYNPGTVDVTVVVDWCDVGASSYIIKPKEVRVISTNAVSRGTYDSTYRFFDINVSTSGESIWLRRPRVELSQVGGSMTQRRFVILENQISFSSICGVYFDVDGLTYRNMGSVYLDGNTVDKNGTSTLTAGKWHHLVANPTSTSYYYYNYIKNPGVSGTASWTANANTSISSVTTPCPNFKNALSLTWTSASPPTYSNSNVQYAAYTQITGLTKQFNTISFYAKSAAGRKPIVIVEWRTSGDVLIGTSRYVSGYATGSDWTYFTTTFYAPVGLSIANVWFGFDGAAQNEVNYISAPIFNPHPFPIPYFDGDSSGSSWISTANNSTSRQTMYWWDINGHSPFQNSGYLWVWNASINRDRGEWYMDCNAAYSNITIHERSLSQAEAERNYVDTLSRGDAITASDIMVSNPKNRIVDGTPLLISAPWQIHSGTA